MEHPSLDNLPNDAILRTNDGVDIPVLKGILIIASPAFNDLFCTPIQQASESTCADADSSHPALPVVEVEVASATLKVILNIIYPLRTSQPSFKGLGDNNQLQNVLAAAIKLDIPRAIHYTFTFLLDDARNRTSYEDASPALIVFAIACRYRFVEEAHEAAQICLRGRIYGIYVKEFEHITGGLLTELHKFQERVINEIVQAIKVASTSSADLFKFFCTSPDCAGLLTVVNLLDVDNTTVSERRWREWWVKFGQRIWPFLQVAPLSNAAYDAEYRRADDPFTAESSCPRCHNKGEIPMSLLLKQFQDYVLMKAAQVDINLSGYLNNQTCVTAAF